MRARVFICIITLFATIGLSRQVSAFSADITETGPSAVPIAMGRAFGASRGTVASILYNPAGLAGISAPQLASMYSNLSGDFSYSSLAFALPVRFGTLGFAYLNQSSGAIYRTTLDSDGRIVRDATSPFFFTDQVFLLSLAGNISENISSGARLKIYEKEANSIAGGYGTGTALDIGLLYMIGSDADAGIYIENVLESGISWPGGTRDPLQKKVKAAFMYRPKDEWTLAFDALSAMDRPLLFKAGCQWKAHEMLLLRAGLEQNDIGGERYLKYSLGAGTGTDIFHIDYAYSADPLLAENTSHFVSISITAPEQTKTAPVQQQTERQKAADEPPPPPTPMPPAAKDLTEKVLVEKELAVRARINELDALIRAAVSVGDEEKASQFRQQKRETLRAWEETKSSLSNPLEGEIRRIQ